MYRAVITLLAVTLALAAVQPAAAQPYKSGLKINETLTVIDFAKHYDIKTAESCLGLCLETLVERTVFECAQLLSTEGGCDLPAGAPESMNPFFPVPLPWAEPTSCVPEEPEPVGFHLSERRQLVSQFLNSHFDCTSAGTEIIQANLPPTGNPPFTCPDADGNPWVNVTKVPVSMQFVPCP